MPETELYQRQAVNEIHALTQTPVVGFGYGLRDITSGTPVLDDDPRIATRHILLTDLIALDQFVNATRNPIFDPPRRLVLIPDHTQGGAVGVWDESRRLQVGWLSGMDATRVNEAFARGEAQHATSIWAQQTPDGTRLGLRIAISTELLPVEGQPAPIPAPIPAPTVLPATPITSSPTMPPAAPITPATPISTQPVFNAPAAQAIEEPKNAKRVIYTLLGIVIALLIGFIVYFAFFSTRQETPPPSTTRATTTTKKATTSSTTSSTSSTTTIPTTLPPETP